MSSQPRFHTAVELTELDSQDCPGILVPQMEFSTNGQNGWTPIPPIILRRDGRLGVLLQDALRAAATGLAGGHAIPALSNTSSRVTLRIIWPGYPPWTDINALHCRDHTNQANLHNLAHIVYQVAKIVQRFYNDMQNKRSTEPAWQLSRVPFSQLYLVQLRNVSAGSWQPVIAYEPR